MKEVYTPNHVSLSPEGERGPPVVFLTELVSVILKTCKECLLGKCVETSVDDIYHLPKNRGGIEPNH